MQVLVNLLSTTGGHPPGAWSIRVPTTLEAVKVALSVAEVGVGVISQLLSHMVRRFNQIDGDAVSGIAGPCLSLPRLVNGSHP